MANEQTGGGPMTAHKELNISVRRRGLFAAAWAAVAGLVAMRATERVQAVAGQGTDGNVVMGSNFLNTSNTALNQTNIFTHASGNYNGLCVLDCDAASGGGTTANINGAYGHGKGTGAGVIGAAGGAIGSGGFSTNINAGVYGVTLQTVDGTIGVRGEVPSSSASNGIAVYGLNNSSFAGPGPGAGGFGVYGLSARGHGLVGATATAGGAAVVGATNGVAGAHAAVFYGPAVVIGDFTVVGGAKSAAVPHPDGSHRRLYCVESPESWFEDFGEAQLACGRAEVAIDPDFAAVADLTRYHVFLSAYDTDHKINVRNRTATGFTVEADAAWAAVKGTKGSDDASFSWRVVAKRKDIKGERLATVAIPKEPTLPQIPMPSERPAGPSASGR